MQIAFDAKRLFNNFTGLGNYSRNTLSMLTTYFPEHTYALYTPKIKINDTTRPWLNCPNCPVITPSNWQPGSLWRTFHEVSEIKRMKAQLFHGLSHEIPIGLKAQGIPSIVTIHDIAFKTFQSMYHWYDRQIYDLKFAYSCKNADHIVAISECTKKDIMRFYNVEESRISVIYQPVESLYYTPITQEEARQRMAEYQLLLPPEYLLYVGSVNSRKNLLTAIKALESIPRESRIPLVVVGSGREYKKQVMEYVSTHGLEPWVLWKRVADNTLLQACYTCARVFIYPSFYEGFGLPVVEAQLCGCPVVTSNVSSLPEAGGPAALLASPNCVDEVSSCLIRAMEDEDLRQKMSTTGIQYAQDTFSPQHLAKKLMQLYTQVAAD